VASDPSEELYGLLKGRVEASHNLCAPLDSNFGSIWKVLETGVSRMEASSLEAYSKTSSLALKEMNVLSERLRVLEAQLGLQSIINLLGLHPSLI